MNLGKQAWQQIQDLWNTMSRGRRVAVVSVAVLGVGLLAWTIIANTGVAYRQLASNLSPENASKIIAYLEKEAIPYKIEDGGSRILAPAVHLPKLFVHMNKALPEGKGWEWWDESGPLDVGPFHNHVKFKRALETELGRTIGQFPGVRSARIHLGLPRPSAFGRRNGTVTAAVSLRFDVGRNMPLSQARGIAWLVSRSVERLEPSNVSLIGPDGPIHTGLDESGLTGGRPDDQKAYAEYLTKRAQTMLNRVLGEGRAIVTVSADINFQQITKTTHRIDDVSKPEQETISTDHEKTTSPAPSGLAGTPSNVPGGAGTNPPPRTTDKLNKKTEIKYAVGKIVEELKENPQTIRRISIAAVVDLEEKTPKDGKSSNSNQLLTLTTVEDLLKKTVNFVEGRDQITVSETRLLQPERSPQTSVNPYLHRWRQITEIIRNTSLAVLAFVALVMGWKIYRRKTRVVESEESLSLGASKRTLERLAVVAQQNPAGLAKLFGTMLDRTNGTVRSSQSTA